MHVPVVNSHWVLGHYDSIKGVLTKLKWTKVSKKANSNFPFLANYFFHYLHAKVIIQVQNKPNLLRTH